MMVVFWSLNLDALSKYTKAFGTSQQNMTEKKENACIYKKYRHLANV